MGFFDEYHDFAHYPSLEQITVNSATAFATPQDRQRLAVYHESVLAKLWGAQSCLEGLTAVDPLQVFKPGRPTAELLRDRMSLTYHLDTFFVNTVSALEIAAQEVNIFYGLGFAEDALNVWSICDCLEARRRGSAILNHYQDLTTLPRGQWFIQLNNYRKCTLHRRTTVKQIRGEFSIREDTVSTTQDLIVTSMRMALPNDPLPPDPVFDPAEEIEMVSYCRQCFKDVLASIDRLYEIIETDLSAARQVPIP